MGNFGSKMGKFGFKKGKFGSKIGKFGFKKGNFGFKKGNFGSKIGNFCLRMERFRLPRWRGSVLIVRCCNVLNNKHFASKQLKVYYPPSSFSLTTFSLLKKPNRFCKPGRFGSACLGFLKA